MQPSRRAFLMAGRPRTDPWGRFFQRLARTVKGRTEDRSVSAVSPGLAWVRPASFTDIHHALALCAEFDVVFSLECVHSACAMPCLLIDPSALHSVTPLPDQSLEVEAGVLVGEVRSRSRQQSACPGAPDDWTVARWMAAPSPFPPAALQGSGLVSVEVLLADRTMETFGPFGATSQRAALSLKASRLVSDLFTWVSQPHVAGWRNLPRWPSRYRIDALMADPPNLAHILLGSGARLAWPDRIRLQAVPEPVVPEVEEVAVSAELVQVARTLDERIKHRFDPAGRFA
jgi:hypothetical protein